MEGYNITRKESGLYEVTAVEGHFIRDKVTGKTQSILEVDESFLPRYEIVKA